MENELYHYGVKNQTWGVRRWQNEDGSLTPEGREHYGYGYKVRKAAGDVVQKIKTKHQAKVDLKKKKKADKLRRANLEKARKAREAKRKYEEGKANALKTGSATDIMKYTKDLTVQEKNEAYQRLLADKNLRTLASEEARYKAEQAERNSKWNKFTRTMEKVGKAANSIDNATRFYNSAAKAINAFSDSKLPIIGEQNKDTKKTYSQREAERLLNLYKQSPFDEEYMNEQVNKLKDIQSLEKIARGESAGGKNKNKNDNGEEKKDKKKDKKK